MGSPTTPSMLRTPPRFPLNGSSLNTFHQGETLGGSVGGVVGEPVKTRSPLVLMTIWSMQKWASIQDLKNCSSLCFE